MILASLSPTFLFEQRMERKKVPLLYTSIYTALVLNRAHALALLRVLPPVSLHDDLEEKEHLNFDMYCSGR